jgi:hypothetical protein
MELSLSKKKGKLHDQFLDGIQMEKVSKLHASPAHMHPTSVYALLVAA